MKRVFVVFGLLITISLMAGAADTLKFPVMKSELETIEYYGRLYADLFEGLEEAFAFVILKDPTMEANFFKKMDDFKKTLAEIRKNIPKNDTYEMHIATIGEIEKAQEKLREAAVEMFAELDGSDNPTVEKVAAFEEAEERLSDLFSADLTLSVENITKTISKSAGHKMIGYYSIMAQMELFEAVEESLGYAVGKDPRELDTYRVRIKNFYRYRKIIDQEIADFHKRAPETVGSIGRQYKELSDSADEVISKAEELISSIDAGDPGYRNLVPGYKELIDELTSKFDRFVESLL